MVAVSVEDLTCDEEVVGSTPSLAALRGDVGQVIHTSVAKQYNLVMAGW